MPEAETAVEVEKPVEPASVESAPVPELEVDHHAELKALMTELKGASPSRIETLQAKMLEHLEAL